MSFLRNKCPQIQRLLSDRIDEPLSPRQEKIVREHLATCEKCRLTAESFQAIKNIAANLDTKTPPDYLWDKVALAIDAIPTHIEKETSLFQRLSGRMVDYAGAVLTFALILLLCLTPGSTTIDQTQNKGCVEAKDMGMETAYVSIYMMSHRERFPEEVQHYYLNRLDGLDRQIELIKNAIQKFPFNVQMKQRLARAYSQKINLFQQLGIPIADKVPGTHIVSIPKPTGLQQDVYYD